MIIKFILKCIALPLLLPIVLIQWIGIFLNSISSVIFGILSGICSLTAIASLAFGLSTGGEVIRMLIVAFVVFIIPHIGNWIIERTGRRAGQGNHRHLQHRREPWAGNLPLSQLPEARQRAYEPG